MSRAAAREPQSRACPARTDSHTDGGLVRVGVGVESRHGSAQTLGTLDVQHAGIGENDVDPVPLGQSRPEHLLLHPSIERHRGQSVVTGTDVDEWVLVGQLRQHSAQGWALVGPYRGHRCLKGGRGEEVLLDAARLTERIADSNLGEPVQPADLPRRHATGADPPTCLEHLDTRHFPDPARRQVEPLPRAYRAVDHPDVGNLLPRRTRARS
jgi:hypothetical protein